VIVVRKPLQVIKLIVGAILNVAIFGGLLLLPAGVPAG
jgi:hypothetical protein